MKKAPVELGSDEEEGKSESKVINQIFGRLQHLKNKVKFTEYIFQTLEAIFPYKGVFFTKVVKANIIAFIKTKILRPVLSVTNPPFQKCQPLLHSAVNSNKFLAGAIFVVQYFICFFTLYRQ